MIGTGNDKICAVMKHRLNFSFPCFIKKMLILKKNGLKKDYKGLTLVRSALARRLPCMFFRNTVSFSRFEPFVKTSYQ